MGKSLFDHLVVSYIEDTRDSLERYFNHDTLDCYSTDPQRFVNAIESIKVSDCISSHDVFAVSQLQGLIKRFVGQAGISELVSDDDRANAAIMSLQASNIRVADQNVARSESFLSDSLCNTILGEAQSLIYGWFQHTVGVTVPLGMVASRLRPGPGAGRKASGPDFYHKVADGPLTYSRSDLLTLYRNLISYDPLATEAEFIRTQVHGKSDCKCNSRLTTVPKSFKTDRTVATEPTVNMMLQLATGSLLEDVLKGIGIYLDTQPDINRELARLGSLGHTSYCTLDLKSASDMVGMQLCKRLLPESWYNWLCLIRTGSVELPSGEVLELEMISTMGNGFTFPLQTIIFSSIVCACYKHCNVALNDRIGQNRFAVFGDDIIVIESCFPVVSNALTDIGFLINEDKTFFEGPFRESCGADWHTGSMVRPVFVTSLVTQQDRISLLNRIIRWSARSGIRLYRFCACLYESINVHRRYAVPNFESDDAGIHVTEDLISSRSFEPSIKKVRHCGDGMFSSYTWSYRVFSPRKRETSFWHFTFKSGRILTCEYKADVNWPGAYLSCLQGMVRNRGFAVRSIERTTYDDVKASSPFWTTRLDMSRFGGWLGTLEAWEASVRSNLIFAYANMR